MKNSVEAGSSAERDVVARLEAGAFDRLHDEIERGFGRRQIWRKAAFVADIGVVPRLLSAPFRVWNTSAPQRTASRQGGAPTGMIMNS